MAPQTNSRPARGTKTRRRATRASWKAMDMLPDRLRRLLWEAPTAIDPISALEWVRSHGESDAFDGILRYINAELHNYAVEYERTHGCELPSWAAAVTRQHY